MNAKATFASIETPNRAICQAGKPAGECSTFYSTIGLSKRDKQNNVMQAKALIAAMCSKLFVEAASDSGWDRPELHRMLEQLREGDTVVVWKLNRLSRSLKDVLHLMERLADTGADF